MTKPIRKPLLLAKIEEYLASGAASTPLLPAPAPAPASIVSESEAGGGAGFAGLSPWEAARALRDAAPAPAPAPGPAMASNSPPARAMASAPAPEPPSLRLTPVTPPEDPELRAATAVLAGGPPPRSSRSLSGSPTPALAAPTSCPDLGKASRDREGAGAGTSGGPASLGSLPELQIPRGAALSRRVSVGSDRDRERPGPPNEIMVVDDIEMNRRVLTAFLSTEGNRITVATDGQEAVEKFEERARALAGPGPVFSAIFMDGDPISDLICIRF
eukprot:tig00000042_g15636.t1